MRIKEGHIADKKVMGLFCFEGNPLKLLKMRKGSISLKYNVSE
jgi:hypothetical protein